MNLFYLLSVVTVLLNSSFFQYVSSANTGLNLLVFLKYLDTNILSRLMSFKNYISNDEYELRPNFHKAYVYHAKGVTGWTVRLGMYGYGMTVLGMGGDGNCMFYSICTVFRLNKIDNKRLMEWVNPDLEPAVKIAIMGLLEQEEYISPINLKRLIQINFFGVDINDQDSVELFDLDKFKAKLQEHADFQGYSENQRLSVEHGTMIQDVNMIEYNNRMKNGEDPLKVIRDLNDELNRRIYHRHGDPNDQNHLDFIFQIKIIQMNTDTTLMNCGVLHFNYNPQWIIPLYYIDQKHFDVAGIYKLGSTDLKDVKTIYHVSELPLPLAIMLTEDCGLARS